MRGHMCDGRRPPENGTIARRGLTTRQIDQRAGPEARLDQATRLRGASLKRRAVMVAGAAVSGSGGYGLEEAAESETPESGHKLASC